MKKIQLAVCAVLGVLSLTAHAEELSKNSVRIGVDYIQNHSSSPNFTSNGPAFLTPQPAGTEAQDAVTPVLAYTRKLNDHWDAELVLGIPPRVDAKGTGTLQTFGTVARVKEAGPDAFLIYNFGKEGDKLRPLVGLGINFTHFYDAESTESGDLASGGPTKITLTNSWGWAAKTGASYQINQHWSLVGVVAAIKVKSDMTTETGSIVRKTTIDFRPIVYSVGMQYRF